MGVKCKSNKNTVITIPADLVGTSTELKFAYLALRNLIYYTDKGLRLYTKTDRKTKLKQNQAILNGYIECAKQHNVFLDEDLNLIKRQFNNGGLSIIPKNDYIFSIEKELGFKTFAFYCNVMVELSFHTMKEYFGTFYIKDTISELCQKMLVKVDTSFYNFVVEDVYNCLKLIAQL